MADLVQSALRDIATVKGLVGGPFGSSLTGKDYTDFGVPVIRGANLSESRYVSGEFVFVSHEKACGDLRRNTALPGDLIFTQRGTLGQVALVGTGGAQEYVVSQSQMRLRVDQHVADVRYVYYACSAPQFIRQIYDNAIATGVPHINLGILSRLTIALPPVRQQRAIAEVLGALDDKIAANAELARTAEELSATSVEGAWPLVALAEIVRYHKKSVNPLGLTDEAVAHFSLPAFDARHMCEKVPPSEIKSAKFEIAQPSVLVSKLNPRFPRVWDVPYLPDVLALASTEFLVLESRFSSSTLLWALLSGPSFGATLESMVAGTSGSHQRVRPVSILSTAVPDPRAMNDLLKDRVTGLGLRAVQARQESVALAATRDALLPALMSGKLAVRDAERVAEDLI